jgi:hypothetical protein
VKGALRRRELGVGFALAAMTACRGVRRADAPEDAGRIAPCGDGTVSCSQYDDAAEAFDAVLASNPLVLAIGEAHAMRGAAVPSSARRFAHDLLPRLRGHASDLLVELMMPPAGCEDATQGARAEQKPITSRQAETDQSEYLAMGDAARAIAVVPDMLRPTCADLTAIATAGDETVDVSLRTIARLTASQAERLVERDAHANGDRRKMVVVYGGALHNELPRPAGFSPDVSPWSYAAPLDPLVGGRLVALDLVVPEFIGDDAAWRALPWWPFYERRRLGGKATLFRTGERSYTLVFAASEAGARDAAP